MQWLIKYSRPCPKCKFPIERFEGCNHVRCQRCQYYFCWQCGGFGNDCMAYFCDKANRAAHESPVFDFSEYQRMGKLLEHFRDYRLSNQRLTSLQKIVCSWDHQKPIPQFLSLTSQVEQVMLWLHGCHAAPRATKSLEMDSGCPPLTALQAVNDALFDRLRTKESFQLKGGKQPTTTKKSQYVSKRKAQALLEQKRKQCKKPTFWTPLTEEDNPCPFLTIDLKEMLRRSSDIVLKKKTKEVIRNGIKHLMPTTPAILPCDYYYYDRVPQEQEPKLLLCVGRVQRLNIRLHREHPPWKVGSQRPDVFMDNAAHDENSCKFRNEKKLGQKQQVPWKGKRKVSERRSVALSRLYVFFSGKD